jgi:ADP-heptose:LPS heptosyltransferase
MVWLQDAALNNAKRFAAALRNAGCRKIITVNFGVGGNSRKRLEGDFEEKLILKLLEKPDSVIVLDQGSGHEELTRSKAIIKKLEKQGFAVRYANFESLDGIVISEGIVGIVSGIGEIASLISQCDEFIGYDSACQHIAASLGIPTYTIFAGSNNSRFIRRWSACGPAKSKIIHVDTLTHPPMFDTEDIITRIIDSRSE